MDASEIRADFDEFDRTTVAQSHERRFQSAMLAEIAAQLAELNRRLAAINPDKSKSFMD